MNKIDREGLLERIRSWAQKHGIAVAWIDSTLRNYEGGAGRATATFELPWGIYVFSASPKRLSAPKNFLSAWKKAWTIKPENDSLVQ